VQRQDYHTWCYLHLAGRLRFEVDQWINKHPNRQKDMDQRQSIHACPQPWRLGFGEWERAKRVKAKGTEGQSHLSHTHIQVCIDCSTSTVLKSWPRQLPKGEGKKGEMARHRRGRFLVLLTHTHTTPAAVSVRTCRRSVYIGRPSVIHLSPYLSQFMCPVAYVHTLCQ
jgi:hypothetical protein